MGQAALGGRASTSDSLASGSGPPLKGATDKTAQEIVIARLRVLTMGVSSLGDLLPYACELHFNPVSVSPATGSVPVNARMLAHLAAEPSGVAPGCFVSAAFCNSRRRSRRRSLRFRSRPNLALSPFLSDTVSSFASACLDLRGG